MGLSLRMRNSLSLSNYRLYVGKEEEEFSVLIFYRKMILQIIPSLINIWEEILNKQETSLSLEKKCITVFCPGAIRHLQHLT